MTLGLGIDTSFDDTAVALVADGRRILANLCVSQFAEHEEFGGIVPERASRLHVRHLFPLLDEALARAGVGRDEIEFVACANRPGLIGSLLVGVSAAKSLAMALDVPLIGVNHLEAHVHAAFMEHDALDWPCLSLLVSGANTLLLAHASATERRLVGATLDDAVGECLDKCGRLLDIPMPAGPKLQKLAFSGDASVLKLPRPMLNRPGHDFSFSGLKTAVAYALRDRPDLAKEDVAAALLEACADILGRKTFAAARELGLRNVVLCGGVAANRQLRDAFDRHAAEGGERVFYPSIPLCTDNAAMIAGQGYLQFARGEIDDLDLGVRATVRW